MALLPILVSAALLAGPLEAAEKKLELLGRVESAPGEASVFLHGASFPYWARTSSGPGGQFRFKGLDAGDYAVVVSCPGRGEVRQTVAVSESLADNNGHVTVTIEWDPSVESLVSSNTVSAQELSVPRKAWQEYAEAQEKLNERDVQGAEERLLKATDIAPDFVSAWNALGVLAYQTSRFEEAERYFREALRREPGGYSATVNLGGTLLALRHYEEALPYIEHAQRARPTEPLPYSLLGTIWFYLGDESNAIKYLNQVKEIDPSHFSHPQLLLARIYASRGALREAVAELEDFAARHPDTQSAMSIRSWLERLATEIIAGHK